MGEPQKIERSRLRRVAPVAAHRAGAKSQHPGLIRVNRQAMLAEPLRQDLQNTPGVRLTGEPQHEVVRKADQEHATHETRFTC